MQLYNEKIYDMLAFDSHSEHKLRFNAQEQFHVEGAESLTVKDVKEAM